MAGKIIDRFGFYNVVMTGGKRPRYIVRCGAETMATFDDRDVALKNAALRHAVRQQQAIDFRAHVVKKMQLDLRRDLQRVGLDQTDWAGVD